MANPRVRVSWVAGPVTPAELAQFDTQMFQSLNGDKGGSWAPASPIIISGAAGLEVGGPLRARAAQGLDLPGAIDVVDGGEFLVDLDGVLDLESGSLLTLDTVDGQMTFTGEPTFDDIATFGGLVTVDDAPIILSGVGAGHVGRVQSLTDADHTIGVTADYFIIEIADSQRTLTLNRTTNPLPQDGETITVIRKAAGAATLILQNEGNTGAVVSLTSGGGVATLHFSSGRWDLEGCAGSATPGADAFA